MRAGNCEKYKAYNVKAQWIKNLWGYKKITAEVMEQECLAAGISCKSWLQDVEWQNKRVQRKSMMEESQSILAKLAQQARPFRVLPQLEEWKRQFLPVGSPGGPQAYKQRFTFLVLTGPSMYGKSSFARALWPNPYYLNVQGTVEPDLRAFDRRVHSHIIHDEANWGNVALQKLIYQSGPTMVSLAKSTCMGSTYDQLLYGIPQVIVRNGWLHGATAADDKDVDWLRANSVVVEVEDFLYEQD